MLGRCPSKLQGGQTALPPVSAAHPHRGIARKPSTQRTTHIASNAAHDLRQHVVSFAPNTRAVRCSAVAGKQTVAPPAPPEEVVKVDSVSAHEVTPGLHLIRGVCTSRLKFEVEYNLRRGTTDNSYVLKAPGAAVLIDVPFNAYAEKFVSTVKTVTPLSKLTHIVLTQLDPKCIPSLEALLSALRAEAGSGKQVQVVLSNPAARLLQSALGDKPEKAELLSSVQLVVARSELKVPVGSEGRELEVILLPTPRWPDMILAYDARNRLVFSSKLFSAHVAPSIAAMNEEAAGSVDSALDAGGWDAYNTDWRHYFECMVAPQARQALPALDKLDLVPVPVVGTSYDGPNAARQATFGRKLGRWLTRILTGKAPTPKPAPAQGPETVPPQASNREVTDSRRYVSFLLPMHGPVVANALTQLVREYRGWTEAQVKAAGTACAAVLYASAYGHTAALAQAISRGITKAGVAVDMLNLETESLDDVTKAIDAGQGFILGSPTLGGHMPTQVQVTLGAIIRDAEAKQMPCGVFGSFGWSGEAVDEMEQKLKDAGFKFAFDPIRVKFRPTAKDLQVCEESGRELALAIKRKVKAKEAGNSAGDIARQAMASAPTLAVGRLVGSLSVLTAKDGDASGVMLASWVSQASFNPPGLTVSVKKDRAMESLLVVGSKFAMSLVPEGKDRVIMKKLARKFQAGEDRLQGLETMPGEITGAPILKDANAYLECQVASRMEAGDHWLIYATVSAGKLLDEAAPTAVHHRKVGNHY